MLLLDVAKESKTRQLLPGVICKQQLRTGESQSHVETDVCLTAAPLDVTSHGVLAASAAHLLRVKSNI